MDKCHYKRIDLWRGRGKESRTHNNARSLDLPSELCVLAQEAVSRMNHINVVINRDLDYLIGSQIGPDGSILAAFANDIGLIGFLSVHAQSVLITVYGDGLEGKLVSCSEDSNRDFTTVGDYEMVKLASSGSQP